MKKALILSGEGTTAEDFAMRGVLECFGYLVTLYPIGRPQDYFDVLGEKISLDYDYLIIGCHGDNGKIIVPVLAEDVYFPDECRSNLGYAELWGKVSIHDKTVICTGCSTGKGELYKAFTARNNTFIAPIDDIEGTSDLLFVIELFYHLSNHKSLKESCALASKTDKETALYKMY